MPRNIVEDPSERADFVEKCKVNDLRVSEQGFEWVFLKPSGHALYYSVHRDLIKIYFLRHCLNTYSAVLFIFLYTPVKGYVVKWPQEK